MFLRIRFSQIKWTFVYNSSINCLPTFLEEAEGEITVKLMALRDFSDMSCFPSAAQSAEFSWVAPESKSSALNPIITKLQSATILAKAAKFKVVEQLKK